LLFDAMRKVLTLTAQWCQDRGISDWRQHAYNTRPLKRLMRTAQNKKRSRAKSPDKQEDNARLVKQAHQEYLDTAQRYLNKARETIVVLDAQGHADFLELVKKQEIEGFMAHADRQIEQIGRRVIEGGVIGHEEKVFSIFELHTEWISKGKAGVPVELGVKVCILEDQHQFILHHQVMQRQSDDAVCVEMVVQAKNRFPKLNACSFDKGFHSTANQAALKEQLVLVALPRKGKLSQEAQATEQAPTFARARRAHSAVESAINALEVHGLDRCPDHGVNGFKRYVALAVLARNIHRVGAILWQRDELRERRRAKYSDRESSHRLAA
jgi:IS5 family transposase